MLFPSLTVVSPQGIGDLLWLYQLLMPQTRELRFEIIDTPGIPRAIVRRSETVIGALPGVTSIKYVAPPTDYSWLTEPRPLLPLLHNAIHSSSYRITWCANAHLENGTRLEDVVPGLPIIHGINVPHDPPPHDLKRNQYLVCYVSGDAVRHKQLENGTLWPPENWIRLVDRACYNNGVGTSLPIVIVGSTFDYPVLNTISDGLRRLHFKTYVEIDLSLPGLLGLLGDCRFFFGYQSGLNVIADLVDAPQLMMYFPRLEKMRDSWIKPSHRTDGTFRYSFFNLDPDNVARCVFFPESR